MLAMLGLIESPSDGQLTAFGRELIGMSRADRAMLRNRHLGFVFQFFHLISDMTVAENISLPMLLAGAKRDQIRRRVDELTERLGISHRRAHRPFELSGGSNSELRSLAHSRTRRTCCCWTSRRAIWTAKIPNP